MIINKFFDPKHNSIRLAGEIGLTLKNDKSVKIDELLADFSKRYPTTLAGNLREAISILYCLGKIKYSEQRDALEYHE